MEMKDQVGVHEEKKKDVLVRILRYGKDSILYFLMKVERE